MDWCPFSEKALTSLAESTARINIWHGAVRSSKTVTSIVRWIEYVLHDAPPGPLIMVGKTERTLHRNILLPMFEMLGRGRYRLNTGLGELHIGKRLIYLIGANDAKAENKLRGLTGAGAYVDEITLIHQEFFSMLLTRLSVDGAKLFGTTNPDIPMHWLKTRFLDREGELDMKSWHFTLDDNASLSPTYIAALKSEFTGVFFDRYIDGLWVRGEGPVYAGFGEKCIVNELPPRIDKWYIGCDYGTHNDFVVLLAGLKLKGPDAGLYVAREYRFASTDPKNMGVQMSDEEYCDAVEKWLKSENSRKVGTQWLHLEAPIQWSFVDPSAASFIVRAFQRGLPGVRGADNNVSDGLRYTASLFNLGRLKVHRGCVGLIRELYSYSWDPSGVLRGKEEPMKRDDHGPDALRYLVNGTLYITNRWLQEKANATNQRQHRLAA